MITIISGTNRKHSECLHFAETYKVLIQKHTDEDVRILALENIPHDWFHNDMYNSERQSPNLAQLQDEFILDADRFIIISPEYNGSIPGVLKLFIDGVSIRAYQNNFKHKKVALVGIASGRAGNLRGMDHLTSILCHMGAYVHPNKLPISQIETLMQGGQLNDERTLKIIEKQIEEFLAF